MPPNAIFVRWHFIGAGVAGGAWRRSTAKNEGYNYIGMHQKEAIQAILEAFFLGNFVQN